MTLGASEPRIFIQEYQVKGAHHLTRTEIEEAVYPYLGPGRTKDDVEKARAALEKEYQAKGYQAVFVQIPAQPWHDGSIVLEVTESPVGRLRVLGARYFLPSQIRAMAPSLMEGKVLNFNDVNRDIVTLNQYSDQRVTPSLHLGATPGTVDVDLQVKDTLPLHGSLELNNRYSANTSQLRLNGALSYDNLWQWGHSVGGSFQLTPEDPNEVKVFSGYYLARVPAINWWTLSLQGTKQDSNVSTLGGGLAVAGRGYTIGILSTFNLPGGNAFTESLNFGVSYKDTTQTSTPTNTTTTVQTNSYYYIPFNLTYSASWVGKTDQTEFDIGPTFAFRELGSNPSTYGRYNADGNFMYLRGELSHTHDFPDDIQLFAKIHGQVSDQPLVSAEQFGGGGLDTVRGYLEGEVFGDDAMLGTVELRSPSLIDVLKDKAPDCRVYLFAEGGQLMDIDPLPQQVSAFDLASVGVGCRIRLLNHFSGSLDLGVPLTRANLKPQSDTPTRAYDPLLTFVLSAEL